MLGVSPTMSIKLPQLKNVYSTNDLNSNYTISVIPDTSLRKKNHFFIAKKFKKTFDQTPLVSPKIKQEDFPNFHTEHNVFLELSPTKNDSEFSQVNSGPRFDKNGQVIGHSILGKPELFMSYYKQGDDKKNKKLELKDNNKNFDKRLNTKKMTISMMADENQKEQKEKELKSKRTSLIGGLNNFKSTKRGSKKLYNKNDLLEDLNLSIERKNQAAEEDKNLLNSLEVSDKIYITKENRILNRHKFYEKNWENQLNFECNRIKRNINNSVLKQVETYRPKLETHDAFELVQSEADKYGSAVWYMTLRLYNPKDNEVNKVLYINDLPDAFSRSIVERRNKFVEKIRKPNNDTIESGSLYRTFTTNNYLQQKLKLCQNRLKDVIIGKDIDHIEVEGKSKFNLEKDFLLKDKKNDLAYTRLKIDDIVDESYHEEIIEMNYNLKDMSKTGNLLLPKLKFKN